MYKSGAEWFFNQ